MEALRDTLHETGRILKAWLEAPDAYPDHVTVVPLALLAQQDALTPARILLLQHLRDHGPYARLKDLADALERRLNRVSDDVRILENVGLVRRTKHGRQVRVEACPGVFVMG